jgi:hypothetical protein
LCCIPTIAVVHCTTIASCNTARTSRNTIGYNFRRASVALAGDMQGWFFSLTDHDHDSGHFVCHNRKGTYHGTPRQPSRIAVGVRHEHPLQGGENTVSLSKKHSGMLALLIIVSALVIPSLMPILAPLLSP